MDSLGGVLSSLEASRNNEFERYGVTGDETSLSEERGKVGSLLKALSERVSERVRERFVSQVTKRV